MIVYDDRIMLNWREWVKITEEEARQHTANGTRVLFARLSPNNFVECYTITNNPEVFESGQFNAYYLKTGRKLKLIDATI